MILATAVLLALVQQPEPRKDGLPLSVTYDDGLWFKTDDGDVQVLLNGRVTVHYRSILDRPDDAPPSAGASRTPPNSFFLRTARIDLSGVFRKQFEFKLQTDFPTGVQSNTGGAPSSTSGTIQDAYAAWRPTPEVGFRIGQFKQAFGQEQNSSLRTLEYVERSVLDRLTPGRDLGAAVYGRPFDGFFDYELAVFNAGGRSVTDVNDEKDLAVRLRFSPFRTWGHEFLFRPLRVGVAGTMGEVDPASPASTTGDALDLTSPELAVKFLDVGGAAVVDGLRTRLGFEFAWSWAFFSVRAEWVRRTDTLETGTGGGNRIPATAYTISLTAFLTGETKIIDDRVSPLHPVGEEGGWGAVELDARFSALRVDDEVLAFGATASPNANAVRATTIGFNWYLLRNVRISPHYILERYNREIGFAGGRTEQNFQGFLLRFQVDF